MAGDKGQIVAESGDRPRETLKNKAFVGPVPVKIHNYLVVLLSFCRDKSSCRLASADWTSSFSGSVISRGAGQRFTAIPCFVHLIVKLPRFDMNISAQP